MDKPKKDPILLNQRQDYKLCLNCGFPNRQGDSNCLYCDSSLIEDTGLVSWLRQTYYILRWRWQLKRRRERLKKPAAGFNLLKSAGFFLVGALLSGVGLYVFTMAVQDRSFTSGLIAVLFFVYGFFTLRYLFMKK